MYITKNAPLPPEQVNTIKVSEIFEKLKRTYGELALPYDDSSTGNIILQPNAIRDFTANNPGFLLMYLPSGPTSCLWTMKKQIVLDASLFYRFGISITSASPTANYSYELTIENNFLPVYDDTGNIDWANSAEYEYMGLSISNWTSLNSFKWSDLTTNSFINIYRNLPPIITTTNWTLNSDADGNVDDTVKYTISSGQISYDVQFTITGTADNMIIDNVVVSLSGMCTTTRQNCSAVPDMTGTLTGTITGEVSSYEVIIWNKMDTLLVINMADTADVLSIYNNGKLPITIHAVTANN